MARAQRAGQVRATHGPFKRIQIFLNGPWLLPLAMIPRERASRALIARV
jgi:hypothetical protein